MTGESALLSPADEAPATSSVAQTSPEATTALKRTEDAMFAVLPPCRKPDSPSRSHQLSPGRSGQRRRTGRLYTPEYRHNNSPASPWNFSLPEASPVTPKDVEQAFASISATSDECVFTLPEKAEPTEALKIDEQEKPESQEDSGENSEEELCSALDGMEVSSRKRRPSKASLAGDKKPLAKRLQPMSVADLARNVQLQPLLLQPATDAQSLLSCLGFGGSMPYHVTPPTMHAATVNDFLMSGSSVHPCELANMMYGNPHTYDMSRLLSRFSWERTERWAQHAQQTGQQLPYVSRPGLERSSSVFASHQNSRHMYAGEGAMLNRTKSLPATRSNPSEMMADDNSGVAQQYRSVSLSEQPSSRSSLLDGHTNSS